MDLNAHGLRALTSGNADDAVRAFSAAIQREPGNPLFFQNRGQAFVLLRQYDWALADFNEALRRDPRSADAYTGRGIVYSEKKLYADALRDHSAALGINPSFAAAWANRGTVLGNLGRWTEALGDFTQALRLEPTQPEHHFYCGQAQFQLGNYSAALPHLDQAIRMSPRVALYHCYRGMALVELQRSDDALASLSAALQLNTRGQLAWAYRGAAFFALERWSEAVADLTQAIRLGDDADVNFIFRGRSLSRLGRWPEAITDFTAALARCPDDAGIYADRIAAYMALGHTAAADEDRKALRRLAYDRVNACAARGGIHVTTAVIQANRELYEPEQPSDRYCLVLLTFDARYQNAPAPLLDIARQIYAFKGTPQTDPELQYTANLTTDEAARKYRRRRIPPRLTGGAVMYAADLWVHRGFLAGNRIDSRLLRCIAEPGDEGRIELLPAAQAPATVRPPNLPGSIPPPLPRRR